MEYFCVAHNYHIHSHLFSDDKPLNICARCCCNVWCLMIFHILSALCCVYVGWYSFYFTWNDNVCRCCLQQNRSCQRWAVHRFMVRQHIYARNSKFVVSLNSIFFSFHCSVSSFWQVVLYYIFISLFFSLRDKLRCFFFSLSWNMFPLYLFSVLGFLFIFPFAVSLMCSFSVSVLHRLCVVIDVCLCCAEVGKVVKAPQKGPQSSLLLYKDIFTKVSATGTF